MSNNSIIDGILESLRNAGVHKTIEEVVEDFQASDTLSEFLTGKDIYADIQAHLPEYVDIIGTNLSLADPGEAKDPTETQSDKKTTTPKVISHPDALSGIQIEAVQDTVAANLQANQIRAQHTEITGLLIDKPRPSGYMSGLSELPVKGDAASIAEGLEKQRHPEDSVSTLLANGTAFIPTDEQMKELCTLYKNQHTDENGKVRSLPQWCTSEFSNDALYNSIQTKLTSSDQKFKPFVAPDVDTGDGIYKNKAWRWNTKGVVVNTPEDTTGELNIQRKYFSKESMRLYMSLKCNGHINYCEASGIVAKLTLPKNKDTKGSGTSSERLIPRLILRGTNKIPENLCEVIKEQTNETEKVTLRSEDFYFVVTVSGDKTKFSVRKQRVPLLWEQAPVFSLKPDFVEAFPEAKGGQKGLSRKELDEALDAAKLEQEHMLAAGSIAWEQAGMSDYFRSIEESAQKKAAEAALALGC